MTAACILHRGSEDGLILGSKCSQNLKHVDVLATSSRTTRTSELRLIACAQILLRTFLNTHYHESMSLRSMRKCSGLQCRLGIYIRVDIGSCFLIVACMRPDQEIIVKLSLVCVGLCCQGRPQLHFVERHKRLQCAALTRVFVISSSLVQVSS